MVGVLQFDVLKYRLENEYNVEIRLENLPYEHIRWIENKDEIDLAKLSGTSDMKKVKDMKGNPLLLFVNSWSIGMTLDRNKGTGADGVRTQLGIIWKQKVCRGIECGIRKNYVPEF